MKTDLLCKLMEQQSFSQSNLTSHYCELSLFALQRHLKVNIEAMVSTDSKTSLITTPMVNYKIQL